MYDKNVNLFSNRFGIVDTMELSKKLQSEMTYEVPNLIDNEFIKAIQEEKERKEQYNIDVLDTLKQIESNTTSLATIINLINKNNDRQDEVLDIITELLAIAKEKDKKVVESKYRKVLNNISTFTGDIETMKKLFILANTVITILNAGTL